MESEKTKNKHIGTLELDNISSAAAEEINITVKFDIDCNMNIFFQLELKIQTIRLRLDYDLYMDWLIIN